MLKKISILIFLLPMYFQLSGCAVNRADANVSSGEQLKNAKSFYVIKLEEDSRGINQIISDKLRTMGYQSQTGPGASKPANVDVVVTYRDKWMWDITMYMLELTVTLQDPRSGFPLANGNSFHTSLTRKSPQEMVDEVLGNIFAKLNKSQTTK